MVLASIADHRLLALTKTLTTLSPEDRTNAVERLSLKSLGEPLPSPNSFSPKNRISWLMAVSRPCRAGHPLVSPESRPHRVLSLVDLVDRDPCAVELVPCVHAPIGADFAEYPSHLGSPLL